MADEQVTAVEEQSQPSGETAPAEASWRDSLPDDIKDNASLSKFSDVSTLAKSYINAEQMIGKDKFVVPSQSASEEEWAEVYAKLGRPEAADQYQIDTSGIEDLDENMFNGFREAAHKHGLNDQQAKGILDFYQGLAAQVENESNNNAVLQAQQSERELREEWGRSFDSNTSAAKNVFNTFFKDSGLDQIELADGSLLGNHPALVRGLSKLSQVLSEDTIAGNEAGVVDTASLQAQINDLTGPNSPYWDKQNPQHANTVEKVLALREMLSPEG
jgi:hypothetical protein|tara:strand:+ start:2647 stop:3465 length:819 start_codon:yes stop_codon:yes gene_type:complete